MKTHRLENMKRGWFIGGFEPTAYSTSACEVAIKRYRAGDTEKPHIHQQADELTAVVFGIVEMNGKQFHAGDIVTVGKGEACDFKCVEDAVTVVYKSASIKDDKIFAE